MRIATKYAQLTRGFFAHAGISDYRIVASAGATEGAPTAGTAEAIVDISTTGCALGCADPSPFQPGQLLRLRIQGAELDIEVVAKVLYQK